MQLSEDILNTVLIQIKKQLNCKHNTCVLFFYICCVSFRSRIWPLSEWFRMPKRAIFIKENLHPSHNSFTFIELQNFKALPKYPSPVFPVAKQILLEILSKASCCCENNNMDLLNSLRNIDCMLLHCPFLKAGKGI